MALHYFDRKNVRLAVAAIFTLAIILEGCGSADNGDENTAGATQDHVPSASTALTESANGSGTVAGTEDTESNAAESGVSEPDSEEQETAQTTAQDDSDNKESTYSADPAILEQLQAAHEANNDVYAWLSVEDTSLDFPVVQNADDDSYYLTHDASGAENTDGAIYTETYNRKDFSDFMTVIYGKNREDRFELLHNYGDKEYYDSHRQIVITTLDGAALPYKVFAAYIGDAYHILTSNDFSSDVVRQEYIMNIEEKNGMTDIISKDCTLDADSHILTLMTGITDDPDHRFLVQAVRTDEQ